MNELAISTSTERNLFRIRIDLGYDGTHFFGWAKQPGLRTVQGELESALALMLRVPADQINLTVGGRTDAGVHARGQVSHLDIAEDQMAKLQGRSASVSGIARKVNGALKRLQASDIHVHDVTVVPPAFDARFSALTRRYEYRVRPLGVRSDPLTRHFTVDLDREVDLTLLQDASQTFLGLQDFSSFCKAREGATEVRTLLDFTWRRQPDGVLSAHIAADAFCHSMVRSLVGGVLGVATGRYTLADLAELASAKTRSSTIRVMPPHGLSLEAIEYPETEFLAVRATQTRAKRATLN